jgi:hypothetical protein
MAGNTDPIFSRVGTVAWSTGATLALTAAANDLTGNSTNNLVLFKADTANGGYVQRIRWKHAGTNVAAVARVYFSSSTLTTVAGANVLYVEQALPAITASTAAAQPDIDTPINVALDPGYCITVGLGSSVAGGWYASVIGGKY